MATIESKFGLSANGIFNGAPAPRLMAGKTLWPPHMSPNMDVAQVFALTASRYFVIPFYVSHQTTFAGVKFKQNGNLNGQKVKIAFYNEASGGGPGTLAKNFGEATLGAATAINTIASSWTAPAGWYYGELTGNSASSLFSMGNRLQVSDVGYTPPPAYTYLLGAFFTEAFAVGVNQKQLYGGDYVGGTYANFPEATSLTPATSVIYEAALSLPAFCLYV